MCCSRKKLLKTSWSTDDNVRRIAVLGFCGVGKSSLIDRIVNNDFKSKTLASKENEISSIYSYGSYKMQFICPILKSNMLLEDYDWYTHLNGIIICYDITDRESLSDIENTYWWEEIRRKRDMPVVLVGNRIDEIDKKEIPAELIKRWTQTQCIMNLEISCKSGKNINRLVNCINVLIDRAQKGYALRILTKSFSLSESSSHQK